MAQHLEPLQDDGGSDPETEIVSISPGFIIFYSVILEDADLGHRVLELISAACFVPS